MMLETFSISHGKASAYLPVLDLLHGYFKIAGGDDEHSAGEANRPRTRARSKSGRYAAVSVQPARHR